MQMYRSYIMSTQCRTHMPNFYLIDHIDIWMHHSTFCSIQARCCRKHNCTTSNYKGQLCQTSHVLNRDTGRFVSIKSMSICFDLLDPRVFKLANQIKYPTVSVQFRSDMLDPNGWFLAGMLLNPFIHSLAQILAQHF